MGIGYVSEMSCNISRNIYSNATISKWGDFRHAALMSIIRASEMSMGKHDIITIALL